MKSPYLAVAMDQFCSGVSMFGPYWDHVLGYWKGHIERPRNVLFLQYEELRADTAAHLKRRAEFIGCPFMVDGEKNGVAEGIVGLCGFENLSRLEVNKAGATELAHSSVENSAFFRRGVVGVWENHLTPEMVRRLDEITESKFGGDGLSFGSL